MPDPYPRTKKTGQGFFGFERAAVIIGFLADIITIATMIVTMQLPNLKKDLPAFISPYLALFIWVIAAYLYVVFLHAYWQDNQAGIESRDSFRDFIFNDLLITFQRPALLIPLVILVSILFVIAAIQPAVLGILFLGGFVWFILYAVAATMTEAELGQGAVSANVKKNIDARWSEIEDILSKRLWKEPWVSRERLSDLSLSFGISQNGLSYILAKYATLHSESTRYGYVRNKNQAVISGERPVLVSLANLEDGNSVTV